MKTTALKVIALDVWGNEEKGFEVNDRWPTSHTVEINLEESDEEQNKAIYEQLRMSGILQGKYSQCEFDWLEADWCFLNDKETGAPVFELLGDGEET